MFTTSTCLWRLAYCVLTFLFAWWAVDLAAGYLPDIQGWVVRRARYTFWLKVTDTILLASLHTAKVRKKHAGLTASQSQGLNPINDTHMHRWDGRRDWESETESQRGKGKVDKELLTLRTLTLWREGVLHPGASSWHSCCLSYIVFFLIWRLQKLRALPLAALIEQTPNLFNVVAPRTTDLSVTFFMYIGILNISNFEVV